jgi:hypothetical protein
MTAPITSNKIKVYIEAGKRRTFAGALDWPGWCRIGRDEDAALQALLAYGPRYARILRPAGIEFQMPTDVSALAVVERLEGNATTDFGAPDVAPSGDTRPINAAELQRFQTLLAAYWKAFDTAAKKASGRELRKGPRGGGRDLEGIIRHVVGADQSYLSRLGRKHQKGEKQNLGEELSQTRQEMLDAVVAAAHGQVPARGPRGGVIWPPRYFVRRVAWHVLDHLWEIEDRISA